MITTQIFVLTFSNGVLEYFLHKSEDNIYSLIIHLQV